MRNKDEYFSGGVPYYRDEEQLRRAQEMLFTALNLKPDAWHQLEREVIPFLTQHHGLMESLVKDNTQLQQTIIEFMMGNLRVLVLGGSPGNGKSLFLTELRKFSEILGSIDPLLQVPLMILPWDKARATLYDVVSQLSGKRVTPPKGVAPQTVLSLISSTLVDVVLFATHNYPDAKLVVEIPMSHGRGEQIVYALDHARIPYQVVVLHSPQMQHEILARGYRDIETSGQPEAMLRIRVALVQAMVGSFALPESMQDEIIANFWNLFLNGRQGYVLTWDPNRARDSFERTREEYKAMDARPDTMSPLPFIELIAAHYHARIATMPLPQRDVFFRDAGA